MVEKYLIIWCSSTLASLKTASLFNWHYAHDNITFSQVVKSIDIINKKFVSKGVRIEVLRKDDSSALIYVYRINQLMKDMSNTAVRNFLKKCGYQNFEIEYLVNRLKKRLVDIKSFPHEIGLFLGYPIEDVEGFIKNKGNNFKCCGYWKVYGDMERAIKEFAKYDKCTMIYRKLWSQGRSIMKLTVAA